VLEWRVARRQLSVVDTAAEPVAQSMAWTRAETWHLVDERRRRPIEPIVLKPGDDVMRPADAP
jgi:hypothetical protein